MILSSVTRFTLVNKLRKTNRFQLTILFQKTLGFKAIAGDFGLTFLTRPQKTVSLVKRGMSRRLAWSALQLTIQGLIHTLA